MESTDTLNTGLSWYCMPWLFTKPSVKIMYTTVQFMYYCHG